MGPRHDLSFCACKTAWLASELLVFMSPSPHVWSLDAKERLLDRINKSLCVPDITCLFCMQNSVISNWITSLSGSQPSSVVLSTHNSVPSTRIKSLYGFQPSPVVLCLHNSDFNTWIASLYGSQPSSVVFACKTATLGPDLQVCMGPSPHLFFGCKTAWFAPEWQDYIASSPHLWFCACKTAPLGLELKVSVCQRPHLWFFHAKQRLYDQTYKSVGVPALTCGFVHSKQRL